MGLVVESFSDNRVSVPICWPPVLKQRQDSVIRVLYRLLNYWITLAFLIAGFRSFLVAAGWMSPP